LKQLEQIKILIVLKRPRIITAFCIIGYLSVIFTFPQVFSPAIKKLGLFVPAIFGVLVAAYFIACVGLWHFKKWGAELYLISFFSKTFFYLIIRDTGISFYFGIVAAFIFSIILIRYYPKMDKNL
jgi:hypothetical protein